MYIVIHTQVFHTREAVLALHLLYVSGPMKAHWLKHFFVRPLRVRKYRITMAAAI